MAGSLAATQNLLLLYFVPMNSRYFLLSEPFAKRVNCGKVPSGNYLARNVPWVRQFLRHWVPRFIGIGHCDFAIQDSGSERKVLKKVNRSCLECCSVSIVPYSSVSAICFLMTSGCASLKALLRSRKPPGFSSADNGALHVMLANVLELEGADHVAWQQRFAVSDGYLWVVTESPQMEILISYTVSI